MNIINAAFVRNGVTVRTLPVYQYDSGMILQISGLDDLPSTFRADFSNAETGQSKSVIGTDGEVHIPYEYFVPGATIHCWLVWSGEDYTVTRKHIMIPIARRATPTDEEPSPDEQGVIDQAIAALNDAVSQTGQDVEAAAGYSEQAEQSAQAATDSKDAAVTAKADAEAAKDQASQSSTSAAASAQSASESAQSASQSKADAQAAAASVAGAMDTLEATIQADLQAAKESGEFDGPQGIQGEQGPKGDTGATGPQGAPGTNGTDGVSPTIAVSDITGGHRVTITDATGPHSFDVLDGNAAEAPVQDVRVDGTSILNAQRVANVPFASASDFGAVKVGPTLTINSSGLLVVDRAGGSAIKDGTASTKLIPASLANYSAFYGLAKAAGSDEKNSTLPVGQYTESAKSAISEMLGGSVSVSGTTPVITALPGLRYVCGEVSTITITPPASGICDVIFESGSTAAVLTVPSSVKWPDWFDPTALEANTTYEINIMDGLGAVGVWS